MIKIITFASTTEGGEVHRFVNGSQKSGYYCEPRGEDPPFHKVFAVVDHTELLAKDKSFASFKKMAEDEIGALSLAGLTLGKLCKSCCDEIWKTA